MSPFVAYHATVPSHRRSIRRFGLLCGSGGKGRPYGVYVYRDDYGHSTRGRFPFAVRWGWHKPLDLWEVAYIGPITRDVYVENGLVFHEVIPPQHLALVTPIGW